jgi:hypothetical protein
MGPDEAQPRSQLRRSARCRPEMTRSTQNDCARKCPERQHSRSVHIAGPGAKRPTPDAMGAGHRGSSIRCSNAEIGEETRRIRPGATRTENAERDQRGRLARASSAKRPTAGTRGEDADRMRVTVETCGQNLFMGEATGGDTTSTPGSVRRYSLRVGSPSQSWLSKCGRIHCSDRARRPHFRGTRLGDAGRPE